MHPQIVITRDNMCLANLIRFLMILGVHNRGYPVDEVDDYIRWFEQSTNAKQVVL